MPIHVPIPIRTYDDAARIDGESLVYIDLPLRAHTMYKFSLAARRSITSVCYEHSHQYGGLRKPLAATK